VTVRVRSNSEGRLSEDDVTLAQEISVAARDLGVSVDLTGLQRVQVAIDALVIPDVLPFWREVLGYHELGEEDLYDPNFEGPPFWFQQMDAPRLQVTGSTSTSTCRTTKRRLA
jgi:4a-hydroxytetrahydrobiopterin dehydratase